MSGGARRRTSGPTRAGSAFLASVLLLRSIESPRKDVPGVRVGAHPISSRASASAASTCRFLVDQKAESVRGSPERPRCSDACVGGRRAGVVAGHDARVPQEPGGRYERALCVGARDPGEEFLTAAGGRALVGDVDPLDRVRVERDLVGELVLEARRTARDVDLVEDVVGELVVVRTARWPPAGSTTRRR
jgi:hypothetical protein